MILGTPADTGFSHVRDGLAIQHFRSGEEVWGQERFQYRRQAAQNARVCLYVPLQYSASKSISGARPHVRSSSLYPFTDTTHITDVLTCCFCRFIVGDPDFGPKYAVEHQKNVAKWISEGTFKAQQSVTDGIDNAVKGFLGMLRGENFGKAVLKIDDMKVMNLLYDCTI